MLKKSKPLKQIKVFCVIIMNSEKYKEIQHADVKISAYKIIRYQ